MPLSDLFLKFTTCPPPAIFSFLINNNNNQNNNMQYIHVKYLQPTDKLGGRYKISKEGLRSAIVPCLCYMESAYDCLKKFKEVNELDWSIEKMAWGTSRDGIVFCFPSSIGDFDRTFKHQ